MLVWSTDLVSQGHAHRRLEDVRGFIGVLYGPDLHAKRIDALVERRLFLKEEVHLRRVRTTERFVETVTLREQRVEVTRTELDE